METLLRNKDHIFEIKQKVENKDPSFYTHICLQEYTNENTENVTLDENTISIVMTASNRSKQVYFTLKTISNSSYKNIQVIIVDDSDIDPIDIAYLEKEKYPFYVDLIKIKRENKNWHNPLVNYNIGFGFIQGGKVIIQNAEVCHIGDVVQFVNNTIKADNQYYVFDVNTSRDFSTNDTIYESNTETTEIYNQNLFELWYQSANHNRNLHFLTSLTRKAFDKIKEFSYDYTMGSWYDDDDFLLKIKSTGLQITNVFHNEHHVGGIHLYHGKAPDTWDKGVEMNTNLFEKKTHYYQSTGSYIDVTECIETFNDKYSSLASI